MLLANLCNIIYNVFNIYKMSNNEEIYLKALKDILEHGELRKTRNSYTLSKFSVKMDFDISKDFPL